MSDPLREPGAAPALAREVVRGGYPGRGLHGSVVERLGSRIVAGDVRPGEALPVEAMLASEADVSRTVVREALRVLASKGLVDARPMRGTRVRDRRDWRILDPDVLRWSIETGRDGPTLLRDLLDVREMIEPRAARLAAERADPPARDRVARAGEALARAADDPTAFIEADLLLHAAVLDATGNRLVRELVAAIETALRLGRLVQAHAVDGRRPLPGASLPAHARVVEAIVAGDGDAAELAMTEVVAGARRDAERVIGPGRAVAATAVASRRRASAP